MASALLGIWPLYLVGSVIVFLGFLALHAWIQGITGRGPDSPGTTLAASAVAFVVGSATIAVAIGIDQDQTTILNTWTLTYHVEIVIRGPSPVTLTLPAPGEPSLFRALNVTNGTASMRLDAVGGVPKVIVTASSNVTFDVRSQVVAPIFNLTLTRISSPVTGPANATIELVANGTTATTVDVVLSIRISGSCGSETFFLADGIREGVAGYSGSLTFIRC